MMKKMMIRGMDAIMLSCEEATYLITKSEMTKVGCIKRVQLKMHLAGCELCRRFKIQSDFIDKNLVNLEKLKLNNTSPNIELPQEKKEELQKLCEQT
ncbi:MULTISPECIES: hypothetical protein [unclassified Lentimicrobium]|uniref:hypothetical protein n=1 Tax=unclassified Lentimicrobium TaxID=2677434 RepID=UPI00155764D8|nr:MULTISPECIES: hypothetical protein [unclassified Lentimicrobium]NPD46032.1 hypothetical protein [Lentimicrobium sp. S6]NPD85232.1 hypothetical protein [Lentimicrobium sp. L6]